MRNQPNETGPVVRIDRAAQRLRIKVLPAPAALLQRAQTAEIARTQSAGVGLGRAYRFIEGIARFEADLNVVFVPVDRRFVESGYPCERLERVTFVFKMFAHARKRGGMLGVKPQRQAEQHVQKLPQIFFLF